MITGAVNARNELIVRLQLYDGTGQLQDIDAVIDTAFSEMLALPPADVARLGLPWFTQDRTVPADGTVYTLDVFLATLVWDGGARQVHVYAIGNSRLLGTGLLVGHDLRARVEPGGAVEIEAIPP